MDEIFIKFNIFKETSWGDNLFIVGNIPEIGNWNVFFKYVNFEATKCIAIIYKWNNISILGNSRNKNLIEQTS